MNMSSPKNLTSTITHLRDREGGFQVGSTPPEGQNKARRKSERASAPDYFLFFARLLLGIAVISQILLLLWMDLR